MKFLPKRIILVRHGECEADDDMRVVEYVPNHKIKLIEKGIHNARVAGSKIKEIVSENGESDDWKVFIYVSPWSRTKATMAEMIGAYPPDKIIGIREECRLREQHSGNFQNVEEMKEMKKERDSYGKFFFRVPHGESAADVYDRVSSFVEGMWREMESIKCEEEVNLIIVSHGLVVLLFLMKMFNWSVDQFVDLRNPPNCECRVLQLGPDGKYSLLAHHQLHELKQWGLSDKMIEDQISRSRSLQLDPKCVVCPDDVNVTSSGDNVEDHGAGPRGDLK